MSIAAASTTQPSAAGSTTDAAESGFAYAYRQSLHAKPAEMARELQDVLGQRFVAYVTHTRSSKTVGRWAAGTTEDPSELALNRLRRLYRVVLLLRGTYEPDTIRAWMASPNPDLGEEIPGDLLRAGEWERVLNAARTFTEA
jgi:hypothetical protein